MSSTSETPGRTSHSVLAAEVEDWESGLVDPKTWETTLVTGPAQKLISLRIPEGMLAVLKAFAQREGVGYQTLLKRWLDDRIRAERDLIRSKEARRGTR